MWNIFGTKKRVDKPKRRTPADVEVGEVIRINYSKARDNLLWVTCKSNDCLKGLLLFSINWSDDALKNDPSLHKEIIIKYSDKELDNFHLLNGSPVTPSEAALKKLKDEMEELW